MTHQRQVFIWTSRYVSLIPSILVRLHFILQKGIHEQYLISSRAIGDPALKVVASGGITTSLILPGSGNLMGGEAAVVKLRPVPTLSGQDMLITANITEQDHEKIWRYMKMACGENPVHIDFNGP